jgi:hypothetical protein
MDWVRVEMEALKVLDVMHLEIRWRTNRLKVVCWEASHRMVPCLSVEAMSKMLLT